MAFQGGPDYASTAKARLKNLGKYLAYSQRELTVARQPVNCTRFLFNDHTQGVIHLKNSVSKELCAKIG